MTILILTECEISRSQNIFVCWELNSTLEGHFYGLGDPLSLTHNRYMSATPYLPGFRPLANANQVNEKTRGWSLDNMSFFGENEAVLRREL
jgi:hypothetical protein